MEHSGLGFSMRVGRRFGNGRTASCMSSHRDPAIPCKDDSSKKKAPRLRFSGEKEAGRSDVSLDGWQRTPKLGFNARQ